MYLQRVSQLQRGWQLQEMNIFRSVVIEKSSQTETQSSLNGDAYFAQTPVTQKAFGKQTFG